MEIDKRTIDNLTRAINNVTRAINNNSNLRVEILQEERRIHQERMEAAKPMTFDESGMLHLLESAKSEPSADNLEYKHLTEPATDEHQTWCISARECNCKPK